MLFICWSWRRKRLKCIEVTFDIKDYVTERTALRYANVEEMEGAYKIDLSNLKNGDILCCLL